MNYLVGKVIKFISNTEEGKIFTGYVKDVNDYVVVYYKDNTTPIGVKISRVVGVYDMVTFKEEIKMNNSKTIEGNDGLGTTTITQIEDKLTLAQEHMNNAYMAVQGILQAHAEKNNEDKPEKAYLKCNCVNSFDNAFQDGYKEGYHKATEDFLFSFTFSDFDQSVRRTWKKQDFKDAVSNAALGLTGEAGEVADLIKKAIYHGRGFMGRSLGNSRSINEEDVKDELSDVLFYVSAMAQEFGFTLEEVARHNREKLEKRYKEGFTVEESAEKRDKHESN